MCSSSSSSSHPHPLILDVRSDTAPPPPPPPRLAVHRAPACPSCGSFLALPRRARGPSSPHTQYICMRTRQRNWPENYLSFIYLARGGMSQMERKSCWSRISQVETAPPLVRRWGGVATPTSNQCRSEVTTFPGQFVGLPFSFRASNYTRREGGGRQIVFICNGRRGDGWQVMPG